MSSGEEYRFKIDAFTPDTLPMARLAEYMSDFAKMLGEPESVHFDRIENGSATLVSVVDDTAVLRFAKDSMVFVQAMVPQTQCRLTRETNRRLKNDNCVGILTENGVAEIIRFPGREMEEPVSYGPFNQEGSLDGKVIMPLEPNPILYRYTSSKVA